MLKDLSNSPLAALLPLRALRSKSGRGAASSGLRAVKERFGARVDRCACRPCRSPAVPRRGRHRRRRCPVLYAPSVTARRRALLHGGSCAKPTSQKHVSLTLGG